MITQGIVLLIVGMAVVIVFLLLLVAVMRGAEELSRVLIRYFPEAESKSTLSKLTDDHADVAVAIAAVKAHLSK